MGKTPHGHRRIFQCIIMNVKRKEFQTTKVKKISPSPDMKHNHNHDNAPAAPGLVSVRFEFTHPTATTVCVAGSFNHWQPEAKTLHSSGVGNWWKETALAPGTYEYCLVVDGQWMPDPLAPESVPNPFGGRNSVLHVAASPAAAHLADAENLPLIKTNELKTNKI
jgi:1,4-alpha-glucan branching enzyme